MKRVICLYRVSTVGQVDHDDIPMQRIACREYAATHQDWEIIDEISEKGVSGYKVSTNARDAIIEIKKRAMAKEFDVLLVFMFDRLGRREDETPFVVQWFVQQGIEVWSTREGEQRFDTHVDKLLNYIRFWQASGESEKTSIRVKTKHLQMIEDGQYRGGLVPYGYRLEQLGRMNKKNKPVPDLVIDQDEAAVVREIFHLLVNKGYGTVRVAKYLNDKGIKTKRNKGPWRGTAIRALIDKSYQVTASAATKRAVRPPKEWLIPSNPKYYDIAHAFDSTDEINWKQGSGIKTGDTVFLYVGAPISAILYKCKVLETGIPYRFREGSLTIASLMRIRVLRRYDPKRFSFETLSTHYGVRAVRSPRGIPEDLSRDLKK